MNDERDRAREGLPPPTAPYLPVQTGGVHVRPPAVDGRILLPNCRALGRPHRQMPTQDTTGAAAVHTAPTSSGMSGCNPEGDILR